MLESMVHKQEFALTGAQNTDIVLDDGTALVNFCSNNYLGLADSEQLRRVAIEALESHGIGMASVRFICGTQDIHQALEAELSDWLRTDDSILYSSCFDANAGLFEALLSAEDAIISDSLNHASLIDGIRLCKAARYRYANGDLQQLEDSLRQAREKSRTLLIVTDGVFSMDGTYAPLSAICDLADRYQALVFVDDSHAIGFVGASGAGTAEKFGCQDRVDLVSGTFGKALGGASGGFVSGRRTLIEVLRQRSRPYLFSNSLAPCLVAVAKAAITLIREDDALRECLWQRTAWWRDELAKLGFGIDGDPHPISPIVFGDEQLTGKMARFLFERGIYAVPFSYPVVPAGKARIRTQISAAHTMQQLSQARDALQEATAG